MRAVAAGGAVAHSIGRGVCVPEALLPRTSFEREGRPGRPLDANVVVRRGVQRVLLLYGVLVALEERISGVLVFGNPALHVGACATGTHQQGWKRCRSEKRHACIWRTKD